jgi:nitrogenase molybdenum-cofactor synthesis protein NifE
MSFSTDLQEKDVIYGGEKKLYTALTELISHYKPNAAFVYSTCIVGLIGDDMDAVCKKVSEESGIPVMAVHSEGFKGTKKDGYRAACEALARLVGTGDTKDVPPFSVNILGDFNIAGETEIIRSYYEKMGIEVVSTITGDARVEDIKRAHGAKLNIVQCSGSITHLAEIMKKKYGIPYIRVSYVGIEDTAKALYDVAEFFENEKIMGNTRQLVHAEIERILPVIRELGADLNGKCAAVYTGGAFKAFSLIRSLRTLGMSTVIVGSQTGNKDDYESLQELCDPGTIIVDDTNPIEIAQFIKEKRPDVFIGGVKERPIAFKMGVGFCDHNHERKIPLAGFEGMLAFAREVHSSVMSPVWEFVTQKPKSFGESIREGVA